jgi:hypothetical protein
MKFKSLLLLLLMCAPIAFAQKIDSVRQVIKSMGYEMPRLSPVPESPQKADGEILNLNGTWQFSAGAGDQAFHNIEVPGEWVMQGFKVKPGAYAEYRRTFSIPAGWRNNRIKLRCDAVYSECEIFINGEKSGAHLGGFTAFETDITSQAKPGKENVISIKVRCESVADSLASGSQYAVHPLGGIPRKIFLMALPEMNCSMFHVSTSFDKDYRNAVLKAEVELSNETAIEGATDFRFELRKANDPAVIFTREFKSDKKVLPHEISYRIFSFDVDNPLKWDPEHPNLYTISLQLISKGKTIETVTRTFGFKQTEVRGNQLFVNNMPIKLRGVCRHEVMPLRGRSLSPGQWEEDVKLFREANVNYIRTSHYPPAPELLEACDRLGMFVEVEGPFCWAEQTKVPAKRRFEALIQPELEMINTFRSNPSVLMWSIGNESGNYAEYFSYPASLIKAIDPTRPRNFSQYDPEGDGGELEVSNHHYPGPGGPAKYADSKRPVTFDEYCHLNAYNRFELVTDPGLRDAWGLGFMWMWDRMYYSKGVLGGALWAAIDDSFILPGGIAVGYGTWGPIDGWRRLKPEYWHVKKVYSPVKIRQSGNLDTTTGTLKLEIENRQHFSNLSECRFTWTSGDKSGTFTADALSGKTTSVLIKVPAVEKLRVDVTDPRGFVLDQYEFSVIPPMPKIVEINAAPAIRTETAADIRIKSGNLVMLIDKATHSLKEVQVNGKPVFRGDALLMVLPLNGDGNGTQMLGDNARFDPYTATCANRSVSRVEQSMDGSDFLLRVYDQSDEANGFTDYRLSNGTLTVSYRYQILKNINPRQTGLVFSLPGTFQQLEWDRNGQWNYYPDDQIGRLQGMAKARNDNPFSGPAGPVAKPAMAWAYDQNELGTNDFRSTKKDIQWASLTNGTEKVVVISDGSQSIRCWLDAGNTRMLVAGYSNMGAERFFRGHAAQVDIPLKTGDVISGTVKLGFDR